MAIRGTSSQNVRSMLFKRQTVSSNLPESSWFAAYLVFGDAQTRDLSEFWEIIPSGVETINSQSTYILVTIFAFQGFLFVESIPATLPQPLQLHVQIPLAASKNPSWRAFPKQKRLDDGYAAWEQAKRSLGFWKGHSSGLGVSSWCWTSPTCSPSKIWLPAMELMDLSEIESS